jgi:hypothetical protein
VTCARPPQASLLGDSPQCTFGERKIALEVLEECSILLDECILGLDEYANEIMEGEVMERC